MTAEDYIRYVNDEAAAFAFEPSIDQAFLLVRQALTFVSQEIKARSEAGAGAAGTGAQAVTALNDLELQANAAREQVVRFLDAAVTDAVRAYRALSTEPGHPPVHMTNALREAGETAVRANIVLATARALILMSETEEDHEKVAIAFLGGRARTE